MSHFLCMVVGGDVETQLAPYHQYECTGVCDEFVKHISVFEDVKHCYETDVEDGVPVKNNCSFTEFVTDNYATKRIEKAALKAVLASEKLFSYYVVDGNNEIIDVVRVTNPDFKWDWYVFGGRYSKVYIGRDGGSIVQGNKYSFDFDAVREREVNSAAEKYDVVHDVVSGRTWESLTSIFDRICTDGNVTEGERWSLARNVYYNQGVIKDLNVLEVFMWHKNFDDFLVSRDSYIAMERKDALTPYAFVKDGKWHEKGEFGYSRDLISEDDWATQFNAMLDGLHDDTKLTVVDCHI